MTSNKLNSLKFEIHLTDHCNLNCIGCNHFSPIAKEYYLEKDVFENDCRRISELTEGNVSEVLLLGGEPLLHPKICKMIGIAYKYFKNSKIVIITNGILLLKQTDRFWETCQANRITLCVTKYPINLNYALMEQIAQNYKVNFEYSGTDNAKQWMECLPLDMEGRQNGEQNFKSCYKATNCITLKEGKLYTCSLVPHVNHFIDYFKKEIRVKENDGIDIYEAKDIEEVYNFLSKPIPFCDHCNLNQPRVNKWKPSEKDIREWA